MENQSRYNANNFYECIAHAGALSNGTLETWKKCRKLNFSGIIV